MKTILLVEDDSGDVFLLTEAFKTCSGDFTVKAVDNGEAALKLLKEGERPSLILVDLNLPGRDGCEIAAEIKGDKRLPPIPVLMLTTSQADSDVERAYRHGVNAFLVKPMDLEHLEVLAKRICDFWFDSARLPK